MPAPAALAFSLPGSSLQGQAIVADEDDDYYDTSYSYAQIAALGLDLARHCFQIDHDRYLLPHGSIDDLINHSCEPTAGITADRGAIGSWPCGTSPPASS